MASWSTSPPYGGEGDFRVLYRASCYCKRVKFSVSAEPVAAKLCDCSTCMRLHSAPSQWAVLFQKPNVRFDATSYQWLNWYHTQRDVVFTKGEERELPCKVRCTHCGSWICDEGRNMLMTFPTLFEFVTGEAPVFPPSFLPQSHIFCGTRVLQFEDGLPSFLDDRKTPLSISDFLIDIAPRLDGRGHKGQAGRIGVLGGSIQYAGAPYYAGMAALRVGAELLYMMTAEEASGPIKTYSPELMVSSVYKHPELTNEDPSVHEKAKAAMVEQVSGLFPRFHALVIGPGLGREPKVFDAVAAVIEAAKAVDCTPGKKLPLILDADSLVLIQQRPELVKGYKRAVLTPNANEYRLLCKSVLGKDSGDIRELVRALDGPIVVQKGRVDRICSPSREDILECSDEGAPRRPGGLGDFLCGSMGVLVGWAHERRQDPALACQAACSLVRLGCKLAFAKQRRAMVAPDVLDEIGNAFETLCPAGKL